VGLALGMGAATSKLTLLLRGRSDRALVPTFLAASKPLTRLIVAGMILLTLSGIGFLWQGFRVGTVLGVKIVMVVALWAAGPLIDNVFEPRYRRLAPGVGQLATPEFVGAEGRFLAAEAFATGLFYAIVVWWVLA
jgi:hypothetical protein